jgi:hypothetical protein
LIDEYGPPEEFEDHKDRNAGSDRRLMKYENYLRMKEDIPERLAERGFMSSALF